MRICKKFKFDAAHFLPNYIGACRNLHGHTWFLEVELDGLVGETTGFVVDFVDLKAWVKSAVIDKVDHTCLNESLKGLIDDAYGVTSPTCERILQWMWTELEAVLPPRLVRLRLYESLDSYAEITNYMGEST